jgi:hypothetical protein
MTTDYRDSSKAQGSYYESLFTTECLKRGISVSQPEGDYLPYDVITDSRLGLKRVQIKGTSYREGSGYKVVVASYAPDAFDFMALYVDKPDFRTWYVFPKALPGKAKTIKLFPHNPTSKGKYEPYKSAFHLL